MTKEEWIKLAGLFRKVHGAFQRKVAECPGYEPTATAVYLFDGLAIVAEQMAEK